MRQWQRERGGKGEKVKGERERERVGDRTSGSASLRCTYADCRPFQLEGFKLRLQPGLASAWPDSELGFAAAAVAVA